nr:RecName: Full=Fibroin heavy chain; Short=Fib-H; AltName: Full=H-fibroin; Flags: Precursor [Bombyx mandarina]
MRVKTFVILCCALQYVAYTNANINDFDEDYFGSDVTVQSSNTTDEIIRDASGAVIEEEITTKKMQRKNKNHGILGKNEKMIKTFVITTDSDGNESIVEEDVLMKTLSDGTVAQSYVAADAGAYSQSGPYVSNSGYSTHQGYRSDFASAAVGAGAGAGAAAGSGAGAGAGYGAASGAGA